MPRYFFNVRDGADLPDDEGIVLPNLAAAIKFAVVWPEYRARLTISLAIEKKHRRPDWDVIAIEE